MVVRQTVYALGCGTTGSCLWDCQRRARYENVTITWTTDFVSLAVDAASGHDAESSHAGKICAFTISHVIIDSEGRDLDVQEIVFAWP